MVENVHALCSSENTDSHTNGAGKDELEKSSTVFTSKALNLYGLCRMTTTAFLVESCCVKSDRFGCCGEGRVLRTAHQLAL